MRTFDWTGKNKPLSEEEFNEMASTDKGLHELRYPIRYQRSDDKRLTGMYVTFRHYENVREYSQEQLERATALFEQRHAQILDEANQKGTLKFKGMGCDFEPTIPDGIGNYRIRTYFVDMKGETHFLEIHPYYNDKMEGCNEKGFYGERVYVSTNEKNEAKALELSNEYEAKLGKLWYLKITAAQKDELHKLRFYKYERVESARPFTKQGVLDFVNHLFGTHFERLYFDSHILNHDDIEFSPSKC